MTFSSGQPYAELLEDHVDKDGKEYLETLHQSAWNAVDLTVAARDLSSDASVA